MKLLTVGRVSYGKDDTPIELREYRIVGVGNSKSCVGTIGEWKDFGVVNGYDKIRILEKNGKIREEIIK